MSGETEKQVSGWTTDTAMVFTEQRINDVHKELDDYKADIKLRFIEVNEFRKSLDDLGQKMQTKLEAQALQKASDDKLTEHSKQLTEMRSRLDIGNPVIGSIQQQIASRDARMLGSDKAIAYVVTGISILFGLIGLGIAIFK